MLELRNVDKKYRKTNVIKNASLVIDKPGLYLIHGINGSGKSTIMKILAHIIYKTSGEIIVDEKIVYLPEKYMMPAIMKSDDYLKLMIKLTDSKLNSYDILDKYQIPIRRIGALSKGNYQKLGLAQLFINEADTYILDEPFDGLDEFAKKLLKDEITQKLNDNKKVILILHQKNILAELKPIYLEIKEGKICEKKKKKSNLS